MDQFRRPSPGDIPKSLPPDKAFNQIPRTAQSTPVPFPELEAFTEILRAKFAFQGSKDILAPSMLSQCDIPSDLLNNLQAEGQPPGTKPFVIGPRHFPKALIPTHLFTLSSCRPLQKKTLILTGAERRPS